MREHRSPSAGRIGPWSLARAPRRARATSLVEVLVVIVIFLIGILAVLQVFPRGLRYLFLSRNSAVATALARDEIERLKSRPDQLPEQVLAINPDGTEAPDRDPGELGPQGTSLDASGNLTLAGNNVGDWEYRSGANAFRRIVGESWRVPAPRPVGADYGGVLVLNFGPIDLRTDSSGAPTNFRVYGNQLRRVLGDVGQNETRDDSEYFLANPDGASAMLRLPSGPRSRVYRVSFSAYVNSGGAWIKRDVRAASVPVAPQTPTNGVYPLVDVPLASLVSPDGFGSAEVDSIAVARAFEAIPSGAAFTSAASDPVDAPYEYKLLDPVTGVLLFNPAGFAATVGREPLQARVDYDVLDWRILRDEFRVAFGVGGLGQHQLPVRSLKVGGMSGPDGRPLKGITLYESSETSDPKADHFVLVDLATGGLLFEKAADGTPLVRVDKTQGIVTLASSTPGSFTADVLVPGTTGRTVVPLEGRALKALYMANGEWSVQVMKAASRYAVVRSAPGQGQLYVGDTGFGGLPNRLYFSKADDKRKVNVGKLYYRRAGETQVREMVAQDFTIDYRPGDPLGLPSIDLRSVDPLAERFAFDAGYAVRDVSGASVAVRVLWNPDAFALTSDPARNMTLLDQWGRGWRRSTTETYLRREEMR